MQRRLVSGRRVRDRRQAPPNGPYSSGRPRQGIFTLLLFTIADTRTSEAVEWRCRSDGRSSQSHTANARQCTLVTTSPSLNNTGTHFYRATLCVSAVFAVARCPSVCLSVRPSVTLVHCIQTAEDIVKFLSEAIRLETRRYQENRRHTRHVAHSGNKHTTLCLKKIHVTTSSTIT